MNRPHRSLGNLTSRELHLRALQYRRMAATARGESTASALDRLAIRYAHLAARREIEELNANDEACTQDQRELDKLIASVKQIALNEPNPVKTLANFIRTIAEGSADPYIVVGVLLEGAVHLLATGIPRERQSDTAAAMLLLLSDRLRANGLPEGT